MACGETRVTLFQMSHKKEHGPQYPAHEGAKISGDPAREVVADQGSSSGQATCCPIQSVAGAQGSLDCSATCTPTSQTVKSEFQAVQPAP